MKSDVRQTLTLLNRRVEIFNSHAPTNQRLAESKVYLGKLLDQKVEEKDQVKFLLDALKDARKMEELCGLRIQQINNYVRANSNLTSMLFEEVSLADDERPAFQNETMQEIGCGYLSQDGKATKVKVIKPQEEILIPLRVIATDRVGYALTDLYNGKIGAIAQKTFDLAFDLAQKKEVESFNLLGAALANGGVYGAFVTTGDKHKRTYKAHSRLKTDNFPATNDLDPDSNTASTNFRAAMVKEVIRYVTKWGQTTFADGALAPTGMIFVPSADGADLADEVDIDGNHNNAVADGLLQDFLRFSYLGNWTIIPDATLEPNICYPILNKPAGFLYRKPSQDFDEVTHPKRNWEEREAGQVCGWATPTQMRKNALRLRYRDAS